MTIQIDHPDYYQQPSELGKQILAEIVPPELIEGECIELLEKYYPAVNTIMAIKYLWSVGEKSDPLPDLKKARWHLCRIFERGLYADDLEKIKYSCTLAVVHLEIEKIEGEQNRE